MGLASWDLKEHITNYNFEAVIDKSQFPLYIMTSSSFTKRPLPIISQTTDNEKMILLGNF